MLTLCVFLAAWGLGYLFNVFGLDSNLNWTQNLYLKKLEIAENIPGGRRIFLIGGSGTHYSLDARVIEKATGIPSVNFGLHAGLGLNAILHSIENTVGANDIAVVIPEHSLLFHLEGTGWLSGMFGAAIGRPGIGGIGPMQTSKEFFRSGLLNLTSFGKSLARLAFGARARTEVLLDGRGNTRIHYEDMLPVPSSVGFSRISDNARKQLVRFRTRMDDNDGLLLFALPAFLIGSEDQETVENIKNIASDLAEIAPVLNGDQKFSLYTDVGLFSDTMFHLNPESRERHSARLARDIVNQLRTSGH